MISMIALAAAAAAAALSASGPPPATTGPVDALLSSPGNFRVLLENERVRVLHYTLAPGARDQWHTHPPRVGHLLSGGKIRVTQADGTHADYDEKTGDTYWGEFSPLHDTLNIGATPYVALLVEVKGAGLSPAGADEAAIRAARSAFNAAIAAGDLAGIGAALADNAQLVTGSDSTLYSGKAAQLAIWAKDLKDTSRGIYVRTAEKVAVSPVAPIAMESGRWRGVDSKASTDWASGDYVAKWRRVGGAWQVESETYMTTACGGAYCP